MSSRPSRTIASGAAADEAPGVRPYPRRREALRRRARARPSRAVGMEMRFARTRSRSSPPSRASSTSGARTARLSQSIAIGERPFASDTASTRPCPRRRRPCSRGSPRAARTRAGSASRHSPVQSSRRSTSSVSLHSGASRAVGDLDKRPATALTDQLGDQTIDSADVPAAALSAARVEDARQRREELVLVEDPPLLGADVGKPLAPFVAAIASRIRARSASKSSSSSRMNARGSKNESRFGQPQ